MRISYVCMYVCACLFLCTHTYVCMYVHVFVCVCACARVCAYVRAFYQRNLVAHLLVSDH
jgi:hypothetical protein